LYLRGYQSSARMSFQLMTKATDIWEIEIKDPISSWLYRCQSTPKFFCAYYVLLGKLDRVRCIAKKGGRSRRLSFWFDAESSGVCMNIRWLPGLINFRAARSFHPFLLWIHLFRSSSRMPRPLAYQNYPLLIDQYYTVVMGTCNGFCFFTYATPSEIRRFKFKISWLCDDHIAAGPFVVNGSRKHYQSPSPRCW
jgi:hypothetical protein